MAQLLAPEHRSGNVKLVGDQFITVTASDIVVTGLTKVLAAGASLNSAPAILADRAQASVPNQTTFPGTITIDTFRPTGTGDATPVAATAFTKTVSWWAVGY